MRNAAEEVADFARSELSTTGSDEAPGVRRVEHPLLGLRIDFPAEWSVEVRHKKKPQGKFFFDTPDWRALRDGDAWNRIKIEGPARCLIEVDVFETEPTVTFDKLAHSKVADATAGKVVESDPDYELKGLRGCLRRLYVAGGLPGSEADCRRRRGVDRDPLTLESLGG